MWHVSCLVDLGKDFVAHLAGFCFQASKLALGRQQSRAAVSLSARVCVAALQ